MSYISNIGGKLTITAKGSIKIYAKENIEITSAKTVSFTGAESGVSFGKPDDPPPMGLNNIYIKVRYKEPYNGEFGFDWLDVNPENQNDIQKIQDVDFSNVEYFYKDPINTNDLGDIVEKSVDETGAKNAVLKHYNINKICKFVDLPFVLIKPLQEITLTAEIVLCEGEFKEDEIKITSDEFFDFEIVGGVKEGKTSKLKITQAGKIDFKIKCLQAATIEKKYEFYHSNPTSPNMPVGGVVMMENKVLKLKFRVIALVSSDNNPSDKAKALFKKFKESKVRDYLNENSLNQAGYEVEIENYNEMDNADVDDYFYAFDKEDWKKKELFFVDKSRLRYFEGLNKDGKLDTLNEIQEGQLNSLIENGGVDNITINEYKNKLKSKSKNYEIGGIIILTNLECSNPGIMAFSRINPSNHYGLIVFEGATESKSTYAHELGHMLGLEHLFIEPEDFKLIDKNKDYASKLKNRITLMQNETNTYYKNTLGIITKKEFITKALLDYNKSIKKEIETKKLNYKNNERLNGNFTKIEVETINGKSTSVVKNISKKEFLEISKNSIIVLENKEIANKNTIAKFEKIETKTYFDFKPDVECFVLKQDLLNMYNDYLEYFIKLISSNYIFYIKKSTSNIMDYGQVLLYNKDVGNKIRFLNHQVTIMRKDYENY